MRACYDLRRCPPTYDVVAFLAHLDIERRSRGVHEIDLYFRSGPVGGFRRDNLWPHTTEERVHMREEVLKPLCCMLPGVRLQEGEPPDDAWGLGHYVIGLPGILGALRAGCRPLRAPLQSETVPGLVTFTLREAEHHRLRNSRVDEWVAAAEVLRRQGLRVEIVRDTARCRQSLPDRTHSCGTAAWYLPARANLYASAELNVGISNGPMWMAIFMDVPVVMLRPTTNEAQGCYDDRFFISCGMRPGEQLPTSPPYQRLVWEEDTRDNIVRAVDGALG